MARCTSSTTRCDEVTGELVGGFGQALVGDGRRSRRHRARRRRPGWASSGCGRSPIARRSVRRSVAHAGRRRRRRGPRRRRTRGLAGRERQPVEDLDRHPRRACNRWARSSLERPRHVGRVPLRRPTRSRSAKATAAVQLLDADTLTVRSDFGANGSKSLHTALISQVIPIRDPRTDGGFATVGLDGWIVRLTGDRSGCSARAAPAESTPLAAAINRDTGLTLIASADGTTVGGRPRGEQQVRHVRHLAGDTRADGRLGHGRPGRRHRKDDADTDAAVVTLRTVDASGHLGRTVARTASLPDVASTGPRSAATHLRSSILPAWSAATTTGHESAVLRFEVVGTTSRPSLVALRPRPSRARDRFERRDRRHQRRQTPQGAHRQRSRRSPVPRGRRLSRRGKSWPRSMSDGSLVIVDVETGKDVARTMTKRARRVSRSRRPAPLMGRSTGSPVSSIRDLDDAAARGSRAGGTRLRQQPHVARRRSPARHRVDGRLGALLGHRHWRRVAELPHGSVVDNVFAAPQGSVVYSVGDGDVREWDLDPQRGVRATLPRPVATWAATSGTPISATSRTGSPVRSRTDRELRWCAASPACQSDGMADPLRSPPPSTSSPRTSASWTSWPRSIEADHVEATARMEARAVHRGGTLHGGFLMAVADSVGAMSASLHPAGGAASPPSSRRRTSSTPARAGRSQRRDPGSRRARTIVVQTDISRDDGKLVSRTTQTQAVLSD